jgi:hypothetical protein
LWLIFLVIGIVFGGLIFAGIAGVSLPFFAIFAGSDPGAWIAIPIVLVVLVLIVVFGLLGAIVETFTSATWTLAYRELTAPKLVAPVEGPPAVLPDELELLDEEEAIGD